MSATASRTNANNRVERHAHTAISLKDLAGGIGSALQRGEPQYEAAVLHAGGQLARARTRLRPRRRSEREEQDQEDQRYRAEGPCRGQRRPPTALTQVMIGAPTEANPAAPIVAIGRRLLAAALTESSLHSLRPR